MKIRKIKGAVTNMVRKINAGGRRVIVSMDTLQVTHGYEMDNGREVITARKSNYFSTYEDVRDFLITQASKFHLMPIETANERR